MREREPQDDSGRGDLAGGARVACVCAGDDSHDWAAAGHGLEYRECCSWEKTCGRLDTGRGTRTRESVCGRATCVKLACVCVGLGPVGRRSVC